MPTLLTPFRGVRYGVPLLPDLGEVMTPPYDVIDETERAAYMARSPYNMIHLILGAEYPEDTVHNNRFTRAAALLQDWRRQHVLDQNPSQRSICTSKNSWCMVYPCSVLASLVVYRSPPMTLAILCRMNRRLLAPRPICCGCGMPARPI